jgi:hypothetical protein
MTTMNPLHDACILNNLGVALLESKETMHAIHSFQHAVNIMKEFTHVLAEDVPVERHDSPYLASDAFCKLRQGTKLESLNQENYYTYDRPLLLQVNVTLSSPEALDSFMLMSSAILIFNFGMACHQFGKETGQEGVLRQAVQIYELTLRMINRSCISEYLRKVVMCLVLNNLANLHSDLCDFNKYKCCLECVKELLFHDSSIDLFALNFLDESEWDALKLNLMHSQTPSASSAA